MDEAKRDLVRSWLTKAQHDLASSRKLSADPDPYLDTAIYHCQQAAEKVVKGCRATPHAVLGRISLSRRRGGA